MSAHQVDAGREGCGLAQWSVLRVGQVSPGNGDDKNRIQGRKRARLQAQYAPPRFSVSVADLTAGGA